MFPKKLEPLDICPKCNDIVIYKYKDYNGNKIYENDYVLDMDNYRQREDAFRVSVMSK